MYIAYHPIYNHPVPENHRFPMLKYELLPRQLLLEGIATEADFFAPEKAAVKMAYLAHSKAYVNKFVSLGLSAKEACPIGFVQCQQLVDRELTLVQGTVQGAVYSAQCIVNSEKRTEGRDQGAGGSAQPSRLNPADGVRPQIAFNIAGGTHHAFSDHGEGFCMLNDQAIAARYLLSEGLAQRVLIVDLDVHQGNGTAEIFKEDARVFTFSMHGRTNYPFHKEQSDLDIALEDGTGDREYLRLLEQHLPAVLAQHQPEFVFYQAGVDVLATDKLGKMALTVEGCGERDRIVFEACAERGLPVQCSMGGGYSPQLRDIIRAHANTFAMALQCGML